MNEPLGSVDIVTLTEKRENRLWWMAVCALFVGYLISVPRAWQCEGVDEIEYLALGHSLATGQGYTLAGEPYGLYPPVYPAALSVVFRLFGIGSWKAPYLLSAVSGFAGLVYVCGWLRKRYGRMGRWAAWAALMAYYAWSFSTRYLMAEQLFVLLSAATLIEVDRMSFDGRVTVRRVLILCILGALVVMTKTAGIALAGAIGVSLGLSAFQSKILRLWIPAVLIPGVMAACLVGWEIRSQLVAPNAGESYGRWAMKFMGASKESEGIVARNTGEGVEGGSSFSQRAVICAEKLGQYALSIVRAPPNMLPVGLLILAVVVVGVAAEIRDRWGSPFAWYLVATLGMICMTSWVSSYHRYLYPATPLIFYFIARGAGPVRRNFWGRCLMGAAGLFGLSWSWCKGIQSGATGLEQAYQLGMSIFLIVVYLSLLVVAAVPSLSRGRISSRALVVALVLLLLHNGAIAAQRFALTLRNTTQHERNLSGMIVCGEWVWKNLPRDSRGYSSLPRMAAFLADRVCRAPSFLADGNLDVAHADFVILTGELRDIPAFRPKEEEALRAAVERLGVAPAFTAGGAAVIRLRR